MILLFETGFSGIVEIDGISDDYNDGEYIMRRICYRLRKKYNRIYKMKCHTLIFNGNIEYDYLSNLSKIIRKEKLGKLMVTKSKRNPNSGNTIKIYLWSVNNKKLSKWYGKNRNRIEEKEWDHYND